MSDVIIFGGDGLIDLKNQEVNNFVGSLLATTYPGYAWGVDANLKGGIVDIKCGHTHSQAGFTLKPDRYFSETAWRKAIIHAGGVLLETHKLNRRALNLSEYRSLPRDIAGRLIADF